MPLRVCLGRIWRRTSRRIRTREELWESKNRETIRNAFLSRNSLVAWTIKAHFRHRREWPARFARQAHLEVVRLRSPHEVARWLAGL